MNSICVTNAGDTKTHPVSASLVFLLMYGTYPYRFAFWDLLLMKRAKSRPSNARRELSWNHPSVFLGEEKAFFFAYQG